MLPLVKAGYTIFTVNHRATPRFQYPAPLEDLQRAVRFIRFHASEYGIEADRIGAIGHSSGGHLVSLLGVLDGRGNPEDADPVNRVSAKVQCVVAQAANADFSQSSRNLFIVPLMGAVYSSDPNTEEGRRYREASPVTHVTAEDPPFLLIHGDTDGIVPFEQAGIMSSALKAVGVQGDVIRMRGAGHASTFPGAQNPREHVGPMIAWFDQHLKKYGNYSALIPAV